MQKIKLNDEVIVIAGKNKGSTGTVQKIFHGRDSVIVSGVNMVKKAIKPTQENPSGGFVDVERPVHLSNINLLDPKEKKATRVRIEVRDDKKVRVAVKSNTVLDN